MMSMYSSWTRLLCWSTSPPSIGAACTGTFWPSTFDPALLVAAGEAGVDPALRQVVEVGDLLGGAQRVAGREHQRQRRELDLLGAGRQVGVEQQRRDRRLVALRVEVVLGRREAVEPGVVGDACTACGPRRSSSGTARCSGRSDEASPAPPSWRERSATRTTGTSRVAPPWSSWRMVGGRGGRGGRGVVVAVAWWWSWPWRWSWRRRRAARRAAPCVARSRSRRSLAARAGRTPSRPPSPNRRRATPPHCRARDACRRPATGRTPRASAAQPSQR